MEAEQGEKGRRQEDDCGCEDAEAEPKVETDVFAIKGCREEHEQSRREEEEAGGFPDERSDLGPGGVPRGSRTSQFYRTNDIPARFENPDCFQGYETKQVHPLYRTTNSDYGSRTPSVHTMPTKFRTLGQAFTNHLGKCGMYRNRSLNCGEDKSKVPEF